MYLKNDGNGGMNISKNLLVIISIVLIIIGMCVSYAVSYGVTMEKVNNLVDQYSEISTSYQGHLEVINSDINKNKIDIAVIGTKLDYITNKIDEIYNVIK